MCIFAVYSSLQLSTKWLNMSKKSTQSTNKAHFRAFFI